VTTRQLLFLVGAVTVLSAGLAWWLQRFELNAFHADVKRYLENFDRFRAWEAEHGGE
jgi:hypothetical protein